MAILFQNNGNATAHALANEAVINATAVFHKIDVQAKGARGVAPLTHVRHILQQEQVGDDQQGCSAFAPGGKGAAGVYYWEYLAGWATVLPHETERTVWAEEDSENHDSSRRVARYFGAQTLAQDPEYAQRVLPNGKSVTEERRMGGVVVRLAGGRTRKPRAVAATNHQARARARAQPNAAGGAAIQISTRPALRTEATRVAPRAFAAAPTSRRVQEHQHRSPARPVQRRRRRPTQRPALGCTKSLLAEDTRAPLILVAGRASDFASADNFTAQLSHTPIRLACASGAAQPNCNPHGSASFDWGQPVTFFPSNGDGLPGDKLCKPPHCNIRLPEIDGAAVGIAPSKTYDGPHLSSVLGSNRVTAKYTGDYSIVYDFDDDSITPTHAAAAAVTGGGSAAAVAF